MHVPMWCTLAGCRARYEYARTRQPFDDQALVKSYIKAYKYNVSRAEPDKGGA